MKFACILMLATCACGGAVAGGDDAPGAAGDDAGQDVRVPPVSGYEPDAASDTAPAPAWPACDFDADCAVGDVCCAGSQAFDCVPQDGGARGFSPYDAATCAP